MQLYDLDVCLIPGCDRDAHWQRIPDAPTFSSHVFFGVPFIQGRNIVLRQREFHRASWGVCYIVSSSSFYLWFHLDEKLLRFSKRRNHIEGVFWTDLRLSWRLRCRCCCSTWRHSPQHRRSGLLSPAFLETHEREEVRVWGTFLFLHPPSSFNDSLSTVSAARRWLDSECLWTMNLLSNVCDLF